MLCTASEELEIPGRKLVLEEDGTEINNDNVLRVFLNKESVLLLLRNEETWQPVAGIFIM